MNIDKCQILTEIIVKAIPAETCPVKNANAMHRMEVLEKRLLAYIADLKKQYEQPVKPEPEY